MGKGNAMGLKTSIRAGSLSILASLGNFYRAGGVPILTYHSIDDSGTVLSTPPSLFERQMRFLKEEGYRVISLRDMVGHLRARTEPPSRSAVITFDDGFRNNYEVAFPVLKSLEFTATFFIVTDFVGERGPWVEDERLGDAPLLSWEDLEKMAAQGMDIQPHSCTHPHLTQLSRDEMIREIRDSRHRIEEVVKREANIFCYPFGEFDGACMDVLSRLEFEGAVAIEFGRRNSCENIYALQRVGSAHFQDMTAFKVCLDGLYEGYLALRKGLFQRSSRLRGGEHKV